MAATGADESLRSLAEWDEEMERQRAEEAHANGFSCWALYERSLEEEYRQIVARHMELIEQHRAAGKTKEEAMVEIYGDNPMSPVSWLPKLEPCDCEEHAFPLFCPQSLVEYRSMDIPDLMAFLNSRNRLKPEEIEIEEGDRSKRLDQEVLERYWTQNSQGRQMKIPFWANADGVVQQIIHQDACRNPSTSPSPPPLRTPSLLYNEPRNGSPSQEHVTTTATTSTSTELDSGSQILRGPETPLSEFSQSAPADSHKDERKPRSLSGNLSRTPLKAKARLAGPRPGRDSRVTKRSWKPAMGLRSCQVTKFYELAWDGSAISPGH